MRDLGREDGFTLIELMVVVLVLGVLMALAVRRTPAPGTAPTTARR